MTEFLFVPPDQVAQVAAEAGATPYDVPLSARKPSVSTCAINCTSGYEVLNPIRD